MNLVKRWAKKTIDFIANACYKHTFHIVLFLFTLLLAKIIQIEYKIYNFNYWLIIGAFFTALILFILFTQILVERIHKLIVLIMLLAATSWPVLYNYQKLLVEVKKLQGFYKSIGTSFYNSTPTYFYQFTVFLTAAVLLFVLLMLYLENVGFGNVLIIASLLYVSSFWYSGELFELRFYILFYMVLCSLNFCLIKFKKLQSKCRESKIKISLEDKRILNYFIIISITASAFSYVFVNKVNSKSLLSSVSESWAKSNRMINRSKNNSYDISDSGYTSSSVKLGGAIKLNDDSVLKVKADETCYLKGNVKDFYDGFSWNRYDFNYKSRKDEPLLETTASFYDHMLGIDNTEGLEKKSITVYPEALYNSSIFAPSFTYNIRLSYGYLAYDDTESYIILGEQGIRSPYSIDYYKSKSGVEFFDKAYEKNIEMDYASLENNKKLKERYLKYLQIPDNISPRIYELVRNITKGASANGEKVKRIEDYLRNNYKYSLEVSNIPDGKEFTDYFLFTEKKGYCTYFATAAAVMFRIAGIPARYVEGFAMDDFKDEKGLYIVNNKMAHAWTEVLMFPEDDIWSIADCTPSEQRVQYIKTLKNSENKAASGKASEESKNTDTSGVKGRSIIIFKVFKYTVLILLIVIILLIIWLMLKITTDRLKIRRALKSVSNVPLYYLIKKRFRHINKDTVIPEDDYIWLESIEDGKLKEIVALLLEVVYQEAYGKSLNKELDKKYIYDFVEKSIRLKQNLFKYYFYKIFLP